MEIAPWCIKQLPGKTAGPPNKNGGGGRLSLHPPLILTDAAQGGGGQKNMPAPRTTLFHGLKPWGSPAKHRTFHPVSSSPADYRAPRLAHPWPAPPLPIPRHTPFFKVGVTRRRRRRKWTLASWFAFRRRASHAGRLPLLQCGDVEPNPGPAPTDTLPRPSSLVTTTSPSASTILPVSLLPPPAAGHFPSSSPPFIPHTTQAMEGRLSG